MTIASRIRKIREIRGWKQTAVAQSMDITQQAYSCLEQGASNARLETLKRFCDVMKLPLSFLLDPNIPITDENIELFSKIYCSWAFEIFTISTIFGKRSKHLSKI